MTGIVLPQGGPLAGLPEEVKARVAKTLHPLRFARGAEIIAVEDDSRAFYLMLEGQAQAVLYSADGKQVTYRDLAPGDIFGELSALDGEPRSAFVTAQSPVLAGMLDAPAFEALLAGCAEFGRAISLHLAAQIRAMTQRIFEIQTLLVRDRLMRELMRRARACAGESDRVEIADMPTHYALASLIGSHREAVSREMSRLAGAGLIEKNGRSLVIPSLDNLERQFS
ncbi:MAG: Crp/Fnr family transcriptional regulator [Alphaproteobacteria bacterium]|nr:MAG: Crp/Fnr family transcriptional regulator [Alphaproteobacteria bacterium]